MNDNLSDPMRNMDLSTDQDTLSTLSRVSTAVNIEADMAAMERNLDEVPSFLLSKVTAIIATDSAIPTSVVLVNLFVKEPYKSPDERVFYLRDCVHLSGMYEAWSAFARQVSPTRSQRKSERERRRASIAPLSSSTSAPAMSGRASPTSTRTSPLSTTGSTMTSLPVLPSTMVNTTTTTSPQVLSQVNTAASPPPTSAPVATVMMTPAINRDELVNALLAFPMAVTIHARPAEAMATITQAHLVTGEPQIATVNSRKQDYFHIAVESVTIGDAVIKLLAENHMRATWKSGEKSEDSSRKVPVWGLPRGLNTSEVVEDATTCASKYGQLSDVAYLQGQGFLFITFTLPEHATTFANEVSTITVLGHEGNVGQVKWHVIAHPRELYISDSTLNTKLRLHPGASASLQAQVEPVLGKMRYLTALPSSSIIVFALEKEEEAAKAVGNVIKGLGAPSSSTTILPAYQLNDSSTKRTKKQAAPNAIPPNQSLITRTELKEWEERAQRQNAAQAEAAQERTTQQIMQQSNVVIATVMQTMETFARQQQQSNFLRDRWMLKVNERMVVTNNISLLTLHSTNASAEQAARIQIQIQLAERQLQELRIQEAEIQHEISEVNVRPLPSPNIPLMITSHYTSATTTTPAMTSHTPAHTDYMSTNTPTSAPTMSSPTSAPTSAPSYSSVTAASLFTPQSRTRPQIRALAHLSHDDDNAARLLEIENLREQESILSMQVPGTGLGSSPHTLPLSVATSPRSNQASPTGTPLYTRTPDNVRHTTSVRQVAPRIPSSTTGVVNLEESYTSTGQSEYTGEVIPDTQETSQEHNTRGGRKRGSEVEPGTTTHKSARHLDVTLPSVDLVLSHAVRATLERRVQQSSRTAQQPHRGHLRKFLSWLTRDPNGYATADWCTLLDHVALSVPPSQWVMGYTPAGVEDLRTSIQPSTQTEELISGICETLVNWTADTQRVQQVEE